MNLLIAEKDDSNFIYAREVLTGEGHYVMRARNGAAAVHICLSNEAIDMAYINIRLPIIDGLETIKLIKKYRPELPVIAVSACINKEYPQMASKAGCDGYLLKPYTPDELLDFIHDEEAVYGLPEISIYRKFTFN